MAQHGIDESAKSEAEGVKLSDIVKTTVYITDLRYREGCQEVRNELFKSNAPASTVVQVVALALPGRQGCGRVK